MNTTNLCVGRCWYYAGKDKTFQCLLLHVDDIRDGCPCQNCLVIMTCMNRCKARVEYWTEYRLKIIEVLDRLKDKEKENAS